MFTWDSSGCMSRESVSIMYYQRHTNRLIEKAERRNWKTNIVAHITVSSCKPQQSRQWNTFKKVLDVTAVIFVSKLREKTRRCFCETLRRTNRTSEKLFGITMAIEPDSACLNHQVWLNGRSLLFHLYTVSEAPNMPADRNEWQQT